MLGLGLPIFVGILWGGTNPLIKRGVEIADNYHQKSYTGVSPLDSLLHHITTPAFILPQLLNLSGSVLFAASLASSNISLAVPLANGTSLAATALVGHLLGDTITFWPGLPGVGLLILGVTLCTISSPS